MTSETINREAGDSGKGFRLQLIRAIKLMLNTIKTDSNTVFFTAVENVEDVSHQIIDEGKIINYFEEDKNYDVSGNFTIFSPPVINTLVSFFDIYFDQFRNSNNVFLGFYTTREVGKERKSKLNSGEEISLPEESVLNLIKDTESTSVVVLKMVQGILIEEYTSQYKEKKLSGHLKTLKLMTTEQFRDFLSKITWFFGQEDETDLKKTILKDIENSPLHNNAHIGKENIIFSLLMEKIGQKQNSKNLVDKLVHSSDVKLIFKEAESQITDDSMDPTWQYISKLEKEVVDKRNLKEKVLSIIDDFSERRIRLFSRQASASKYEENEADKTFLSLKYRIYNACEECFSASDYKIPKAECDLDTFINNMVSKAVSDISELKKDYQYTISNNKTIEGIVWNLFDGCFIAFDDGVNE